MVRIDIIKHLASVEWDALSGDQEQSGAFPGRLIVHLDDELAADRSFRRKNVDALWEMARLMRAHGMEVEVVTHSAEDSLLGDRRREEAA